MKIHPGTTLFSKLLTLALFQATVYAGIWLWDDYVASYITLIFPLLILVILLIAIIADQIEPSRIPQWYFWMMVMSILIPLLIGGIFFLLFDGQLAWLKPM